MYLRRFYFFVFFILFCSASYGQSGWTREKGHFFVKLDFSNFSSDAYYNPNGDKLTTNTFTQNSFNFYGEYGLLDRLTVVAAIPLLRSNSFAGTEKAIGIGDLRLDFKYRLTSNELPISIILAPELPTGRSNVFVSSKDNPQDRINLPTGDGEFNVWSGVAASKSFGKFYTSVFGMYNFRTKYKGEAFVDLYQFGAEVGLNPISKLWVNAKVRAQFATKDSESPNLSFVRGDATTFTLVSFEAIYKVNNQLGFSATYLSGGNWIAPFNNIYIASFGSLGVMYEF